MTTLEAVFWRTAATRQISDTWPSFVRAIYLGFDLYAARTLKLTSDSGLIVSSGITLVPLSIGV